MKLKFTKKLILDSVETKEGIKTISFASYLKEEYIERLIKISIKNNIVISMYFSSNEYGTTTWMIEKGFVDSHRWESDDDLNKISYIARRYPAPLENGIISNDYAFEKIVPDVLDNMIDLELSLIIFKIAKSPNENIIYNWDEIISKNKELSDAFISELIQKYENQIKELNSLEENEEIGIQYKNDNKNGGKAFVKNNHLYFEKLKRNISKELKRIQIQINNRQVKEKVKEDKIKKSNSQEFEDIKEYLERAKKLSKKIKKF